MKRDILLRSFMFLPAFNRKYIYKAIESEADAIILDVEDSVPETKRKEAREIVKELASTGLFENKKVFIRINELGTKDFVEDISELMVEGIDGFMPSKINTAEDVVFIDKLLSFLEMKKDIPVGTYFLTPLIETTKAINNVHSIAESSDRIIALCLGGEDYLNDLGSVYTYQESALEVPRAMVVNAARSNGLLPIDTPFLNINDLHQFEDNEKKAYKNGFAGCLLVNPKQIQAANRAFSPDEEMISHAQRVMDAVQNSILKDGASVVMLDGGMVGPPMRKRAELIMKQKRLIDIYNGELVDE